MLTLTVSIWSPAVQPYWHSYINQQHWGIIFIKSYPFNPFILLFNCNKWLYLYHKLQIYRLIFTSFATWKSGCIAVLNLVTNLNLCWDTPLIVFYGNLTRNCKVITRIWDISAKLFSLKIMINKYILCCEICKNRP